MLGIWSYISIGNILFSLGFYFSKLLSLSLIEAGSSDNDLIFDNGPGRLGKPLCTGFKGVFTGSQIA